MANGRNKHHRFWLAIQLSIAIVVFILSEILFAAEQPVTWNGGTVSIGTYNQYPVSHIVYGGSGSRIGSSALLPYFYLNPVPGVEPFITGFQYHVGLKIGTSSNANQSCINFSNPWPTVNNPSFMLMYFNQDPGSYVNKPEQSIPIIYSGFYLVQATIRFTETTSAPQYVWADIWAANVNDVKTMGNSLGQVKLSSTGEAPVIINNVNEPVTIYLSSVHYFNVGVNVYPPRLWSTTLNAGSDPQICADIIGSTFGVYLLKMANN